MLLFSVLFIPFVAPHFHVASFVSCLKDIYSMSQCWWLIHHPFYIWKYLHFVSDKVFFGRLPVLFSVLGRCSPAELLSLAAFKVLCLSLVSNWLSGTSVLCCLWLLCLGPCWASVFMVGDKLLSHYALWPMDLFKFVLMSCVKCIFKIFNCKNEKLPCWYQNQKYLASYSAKKEYSTQNKQPAVMGC